MDTNIKKNILFYDDKGLFYGSVEKLIQLLAKNLVGEFNVYLAYAPKNGEQLRANIENTGVTLIPFDFDYQQKREPHRIVGMAPSIMEIVRRYNIHCIYTSVFAHYQFPMCAVPASIPFVLVSPFGHYCSNGNVVKTYVSGKENYQRLIRRCASNPELYFNPLVDSDESVWNRKPIGDRVVFGRIGRGEDANFDPIAIRAFAKLEKKYGDRVFYVVVNPAPSWERLAQELGVKNIEYRKAIPESALPQFFKDIDVFAHARKDGETVGMAIAEAMLSGCPILTHRSTMHNDHFDILDASYAKWAEVDDVEAYFENMCWMVDHKDQVREMGLAARERSRKIFAIESQRAEWIKIFHEACSRYSHDTKSGQALGYARLWMENFKAVPFLIGKWVGYMLPGLEGRLRGWYRVLAG